MSHITRPRAVWAIALLLLLPVVGACGGSTTSPTRDAGTAVMTTASTPGTATTVQGGPSLTNTPPVMATATPMSEATPAASPVASTTPVANGTLPPIGHETEISFKSGPDTLYGSLLMPAVPGSSSAKVPAALIISGSGPTDRNGNDAQLQHMNTNLNFARALAADGIASFRYDKLGAGKTGLASHADGKGITFDLFVQEALDAYATMAKQPGIDPSRLTILGHSEGGLFALVLAKDLKGKPDAPKSLVLAAPLGRRFLDVIKRQVTDQVHQAEAANQMTANQGKALLGQLDDAITGLRTTGKLPDTVTDTSLVQLFSPVNIPFIVAEDKIDPADIASQFGQLPVLVMRGTKDQQVSQGDIDHLMQGFAKAGNANAKAVSLPDVDHIFKVVPGTPNPSVDYNNPDLAFSPQAVSDVRAFVEKWMK